MSSDREATSDSSHSSLSSVSEDEDVPIPCGAIEPYRFEPEYSSEENEEAQGDAEENVQAEAQEDRRANLDWCRCGNCQIMDRVEENKCCLEMDRIADKNEVEEPPHCIIYTAPWL